MFTALPPNLISYPPGSLCEFHEANIHIELPIFNLESVQNLFRLHNWTEPTLFLAADLWRIR